MSEAKPILVEVAPGELIDKITILQIKTERMSDPQKVRNVGVDAGVSGNLTTQLGYRFGYGWIDRSNRSDGEASEIPLTESGDTDPSITA